MSKLLHINAAPFQSSKSYLAAAEFIKSYTATNPSHEVVTWDLFDEKGGPAGVPVPQFLKDDVLAKFASFAGPVTDPALKGAWDEVVTAINFFKSFDRYIFSIPMWNFTIPHVLKNLIDVLVQPGQTFSVDRQTGSYNGLVTGKPAVLFFARGGVYAAGSPIDFQKPYVEFVLKFIGITDITSVLVEGLSNPSTAEENVKKALAEAHDLGAKWPSGAATAEKN